MAQLNISSTTAGNTSTNIDSTTIDTKQIDGVLDQEESYWINTNFKKWLGIYKTIPEVKTAIDMRAIWTGGNGYKADPRTEAILDHISGWGNDNFNSIMKNMRVMRRVAGDSFAEIIRDSDGTLMNLKPLNPQNIKIIVDKKGIIKRYEQMDKQNKKTVFTFKRDQIFHLSNKRVADEIHGVSDIECIEEIILANKESFVINKQIIKNFSRPKMMVEVDEDNQSKIDVFATKFDKATNTGDNLYYPKGTATPSVLAVSPNATLNIMPWREHLKNYFYQVVGMPQIIMGSSGEFTESTAKIAYLAFEQSVDDEQNEDEAQVWNQLQLRVKWSFPASMRNELITDEAKDSNAGTSFQPSDTTAGVGK
jgi:hypothetical protein